jgi:hypothetical protein
MDTPARQGSRGWDPIDRLVSATVTRPPQEVLRAFASDISDAMGMQT